MTILGQGTSGATALLDRLDGVKSTGPGRWIAKCPGHDDRRPSLYVSEADAGRVLIHCFGGCDPGAVLDAVGMEFADLFPQETRHQHARPSRSRIPAADLLLMLDEEATAVGILAAQILERRTITDTDWQRLAVAVRRIGVVVAHRSVRP